MGATRVAVYELIRKSVCGPLRRKLGSASNDSAVTFLLASAMVASITESDRGAPRVELNLKCKASLYLLPEAQDYILKDLPGIHYTIDLRWVKTVDDFNFILLLFP